MSELLGNPEDSFFLQHGSNERNFVCRPRVLPIPGADLENVFTLRTPDDANKIAENIGGKNVVIVGSSFIGECCDKV